MNGQDLTVRSENKMVSKDTWNTLYLQAAEIIKSGFLPPSIKTPAQAIAVILTGRELGIGMMEAFRGIHIIDNRPSISPQLMMSLIYNSGVAENIKIESTATACIVSGNRKGQPPIVVKFTEEDAKNLNLLFKDNWKKQKQNMLRWRAISAWARLACPDVIGGLYTPEELENPDEDIGIAKSGLELSEKLNASPEDAEKFYEETATKILEDLAKCENDKDVWAVENAYKQEIGLFNDSEREYIKTMIDSKRNELVTGNKSEEAPKEAEIVPEPSSQAPKTEISQTAILKDKEEFGQAFLKQVVAEIALCTTKAQLMVFKNKKTPDRMKLLPEHREYFDALLSQALIKAK